MFTIQKDLEYNAWANTKVAEFLANVDDKVLDAELKSSFPSIRKTILHLWDAEQIWLSRLQGSPKTTWPSESFNGTKEELLAGFVQGSKDIANFAASKDSAYLTSPVTYKNMAGKEFTSSVDEIFSHVVNHGTFHRGQLITMLRELGFTTFESQDLITYLRQL